MLKHVFRFGTSLQRADFNLLRDVPTILRLGTVSYVTFICKMIYKLPKLLYKYNNLDSFFMTKFTIDQKLDVVIRYQNTNDSVEETLKAISTALSVTLYNR